MMEQPRERDVPCRRCPRRTWNTTAVCDWCGNAEEEGYRAAEDRAERGAA